MPARKRKGEETHWDDPTLRIERSSREAYEKEKAQAPEASGEEGAGSGETEPTR